MSSDRHRRLVTRRLTELIFIAHARASSRGARSRSRLPWKEPPHADVRGSSKGTTCNSRSSERARSAAPLAPTWREVDTTSSCATWTRTTWTRSIATDLRIEGPVEEFTVRVRAITPDELPEQIEHVAIAVKSHHTHAAAELVRGRIAPGGYLVSFQNGFHRRHPRRGGRAREPHRQFRELWGRRHGTGPRHARQHRHVPRRRAFRERHLAPRHRTGGGPALRPGHGQHHGISSGARRLMAPCSTAVPPRISRSPITWKTRVIAP